MKIVNAKEILLPAVGENYAVGAFNVTSIIQMQAVIEASVEKKAPVIIQTSTRVSKFVSPQIFVSTYKTLAESAPIPVCLHLDHTTDLEYCQKCADVGYTSIMIDASKKSFEDNIYSTKQICDYCHSVGDISVEGELGTVSGVEDQVKVAEDEAALCPPDQAIEFIERTGVDLFAPAIGTAHGIYHTKNPKIDFERLAKISKLIKSSGLRIPLVVHGGTGLPEDTVRRLIAAGGSKFNVSTELKHTLIDTTFDYISRHRNEYEPGKIDAAVKEATRDLVGRWIDLLCSANKA